MRSRDDVSSEIIMSYIWLVKGTKNVNERIWFKKLCEFEKCLKMSKLVTNHSSKSTKDYKKILFVK